MKQKNKRPKKSERKLKCEEKYINEIVYYLFTAMRKIVVDRYHGTHGLAQV